jgi:hypothetical protein
MIDREAAGQCRASRPGSHARSSMADAAPACPDAAVAPALAANWSVLSAEEQRTAAALLAAGQAHLFAAWPAPGERDADKKRLLKQARPARRAERARRSDTHARIAPSACARGLLPPACRDARARAHAAPAAATALTHPPRCAGGGAGRGAGEHGRAGIVRVARAAAAGGQQERQEPLRGLHALRARGARACSRPLCSTPRRSAPWTLGRLR